MLFEQIRPYLRFVRYLELDGNSSYSSLVPYDARMFYATSGSGAITAGGKSYIIQKGCMLIIPAGVEYMLHTPESGVVYLAINFDYSGNSSDKKTSIPPAPPSHFDISYMTESVTFDNLTQFNSPLHFTEMFSAEKRLEELEREFARKLVLYEFKISSIFADILSECARLSGAIGFSPSEKTAEKNTQLHTFQF